ncbi:hypothetical protein ISP17_01870 [Dyella ginsengisoli]|jgi:hypothetical protein|uniref:Uncharacterized protein n=1 Tax=Dyella ginsengisoli TaxID=363848 RepID=A0ABW8JQY2_9GAMM
MRLAPTHIFFAAALACALAACSPSEPPPARDAPTPRAQVEAPANPALGSSEWYAWVDRTLGITDNGHGPDRGSAEWNAAVQHQLGQEAPQAAPGSPEWQQAVDALLRTRATVP